ncbi:MAG: toxic anion resistance protein [Nanoarchaeota archaeon]|nr:toxic anion resistance protein [Nanoarchaeota archaeon]
MTQETAVKEVVVGEVVEVPTEKETQTENLPAVLNPQAPKLPADEISKADEVAQQLAATLLEDPDNRSVLREMTSLGQGSQDRCNGEFHLMRKSLGTTMKKMKSGEKNELPGNMLAMRKVMDDMNPYPALEQLKQVKDLKGVKGWMARTFKKVPKVGEILYEISVKYESLQDQVDAIVGGLRLGSDRLLENVLEIEQRYVNLQDLQKVIQLKAYQVETIWSALEKAKEQNEDDTINQKLQAAIVKSARRAQNLRITEQAFNQFFVTMNMTMDTHDSLRDGILSMITLTRPVLENGLALQVAQQEEREIAEALAANQEYLGNMMKQIATSAAENSEYVTDLVNSPLMKIQDLTDSYNILMKSMEKNESAQVKMVEGAKEAVEQLKGMSDVLEQKANAQADARKSIGNVGIIE